MTNNQTLIQTPIAIIGMGITGHSVLDLLLALGFSENEIILFDQKTPASTSQNIVSDVAQLKQLQPKTLIVSPGVPLSTPWILEFKKTGTKISSELSLAYHLLTSEKVIAVTGSLGKSTTISLLKHALEHSKIPHFVGGNLGQPLANYTLEVISKKRERAEWVCLEISSYQQENFSELQAEYSAITYFAPNHLERYSSLEDYYNTKWTLTQHTRRALVCNKNGGDLEFWVKNHPTSLETKWVDRNSTCIGKYGLDRPALLGSHNLDNLAVAATLAELAGWPEDCIKSMSTFAGLPHRVENLGVQKGIRYVNDSKATTIESVLTAVYSSLESIPSDRNLHLLLGGRDKNLPWEKLTELAQKSQIKFYFFGECRELAKTKSKLSGLSYLKLGEAVDASQKQARDGDAILLSPGGTSLDEFRNFEARGNYFKLKALA